MEASRSSHGIMDGEEEVESVSSFYSEEDDSSVDEELREDATSSSSSSSLCPPPSSVDQLEGPLFEMSSLIALLPVKRGLSKHFDGKSQSFTSLANVRYLEDLAKPERPHKKRLKSCQSYGGGLDCHKAVSPKSRTITKKASSLLNARRHSFSSQRPPLYPQRSSSLSGHTFLFA